MKKLIPTFFILTLLTGCNPIYNANGWSIWGYSSEKKEKVFHVGFVSTDFYFDNAGNEYQTTKEKNNNENKLTNDLGLGTIGIYRRKEF